MLQKELIRETYRAESSDVSFYQLEIIRSQYQYCFTQRDFTSPYRGDTASDATIFTVQKRQLNQGSAMLIC